MYIIPWKILHHFWWCWKVSTCRGTINEVTSPTSVEFVRAPISNLDQQLVIAESPYISWGDNNWIVKFIDYCDHVPHHQSRHKYMVQTFKKTLTASRINSILQSPKTHYIHLFPTKSHITPRHLGPRHTTPNCPIHQSIKHSKQRGSFGLKEIFQLILWNLRYGHHIDGIEDLHDFRGQKPALFARGWHGLDEITCIDMIMIYCSHDRDILTLFFLSFCSAPPSPPLLASSSMTNATIISKPKAPRTHRHIAKQLSSFAVGEQVWMMPPSHGALPGEPTGEPVRHILACQFSPLKSFTPKIYSVWIQLIWKETETEVKT